MQYPEHHQITPPSDIPISLKDTLLSYKTPPSIRVWISSHHCHGKKHIDRIKKKSNSMLGFLCRNLKSTCAETKTNAYISMVRPSLEYCSFVYIPNQKELIQNIEMIQRRTAKYVSNRYRNTSSVLIDA